METSPGVPIRVPGSPSAAVPQGPAPHEPRGSEAAVRAREIQEMLAAARASAPRSTNAGVADRAPGGQRVLEGRAAAGSAPAPACRAGQPPAGEVPAPVAVPGAEASAALETAASADDGAASAWAAAIASRSARSTKSGEEPPRQTAATKAAGSAPLPDPPVAGATVAPLGAAACGMDQPQFSATVRIQARAGHAVAKETRDARSSNPKDQNTGVRASGPPRAQWPQAMVLRQAMLHRLESGQLSAELGFVGSPTSSPRRTGADAVLGTGPIFPAQRSVGLVTPDLPVLLSGGNTDDLKPCVVSADCLCEPRCLSVPLQPAATARRVEVEQPQVESAARISHLDDRDGQPRGLVARRSSSCSPERKTHQAQAGAEMKGLPQPELLRESQDESCLSTCTTRPTSGGADLNSLDEALVSPSSCAETTAGDTGTSAVIARAGVGTCGSETLQQIEMAHQWQHIQQQQRAATRKALPQLSKALHRQERPAKEQQEHGRIQQPRRQKQREVGTALTEGGAVEETTAMWQQVAAAVKNIDPVKLQQLESRSGEARLSGEDLAGALIREKMCHLRRANAEELKPAVCINASEKSELMQILRELKPVMSDTAQKDLPALLHEQRRNAPNDCVEGEHADMTGRDERIVNDDAASEDDSWDSEFEEQCRLEQER